MEKEGGGENGGWRGVRKKDIDSVCDVFASDILCCKLIQYSHIFLVVSNWDIFKIFLFM